MNTQTLLKDTKDRQFDYYMPQFGGIKPVCHDRHKTVPKFILFLYDKMWTKIRYMRIL